MTWNRTIGSYCGSKSLGTITLRRFLAALALAALTHAPAVAQAPASDSTTIVVNIFDQRHAISPYVYGGNFPNTDPTTHFIQKTGTTLSRWGGNSITTYNWDISVRDTAADWYFENFKDNSGYDWIGTVEKEGSAAIVGIPMVDWTPKGTDLHSFSIAKYGPQQKTDPERPDCGNGFRPDGKTFVVNDPNDAYVPLRDQPEAGDPAGTVYRDVWIQKIAQSFGSHPHFYEFDNEPEIWNGTHRDIHPQPVTYSEMRDKYLDMEQLVSSIDPKAILTGPTVDSWWFYWNSAAGPSDKEAHGGVDYLPWWLGQIADAARKSHARTLDVFDVHAYPDFDHAGPPAQVDASLVRSPREYWDPTFVSEGGIGTGGGATKTQPDANAPAIISRFRALVNAIYPGTKFGITEWGFFQDDDVSASLADADMYGIFGREGVYLATRFLSPAPNSVCSLALEMYKSFASISVEDTASIDVNLFATYAAISKDGHSLTVMAINKDPDRSVAAALNFRGFQAHTVTAYQRIGGAKTLTALPPTGAPASFTFPPYSQTLLVFQGASQSGAVHWSIDRDDLMMTTGSRAVLHAVLSGKTGSLNLTNIDAPTEITMSIRTPLVNAGRNGAIDVTAGSQPGFYRYTVTGKTSTGRIEKQSGWIVVGLPGSLPTPSGP